MKLANDSSIRTVGHGLVTAVGVGILMVGGTASAAGSAAVAGRYTFYNNSFHDGYDPAITTADFAAIDPSKLPLLNGRGPATFANWTGCTHGITGLAYDFANVTLTPNGGDFYFFLVGRDGSSLPIEIAPSSFAVFTGGGVNGSTRVMFAFPAGLVKNTWLQVYIDTSFGLQAADVHYWGNAAGDTGSILGDEIVVDQADELAIENHPWPNPLHPLPGPIPVDWHWNINKDEWVNATDIALCRLHRTTVFTTVKIIDTTASAVLVGRHIFYNQSYYDGNKAGIDPLPIPSSGLIPNNDDGDAIDFGKRPLMPGGGMATFANWTGYNKGINGLIYDFATSSRDPVLTDFLFHNINQYGTAPLGLGTAVVPNQFFVQDLGGIKRAIITFANGTVKNTWLRVDIGTGFGLPAPDVHYWGNAVADTGQGNPPPYILINATDEIAIRNHPGNMFHPVYVDSPYDINKDRLIDATDQILARNQPASIFTCVRMISR